MSVRVHIWAAASRHAIVVRSSNWSHDGRPYSAVPTASTWIGGLRRSGAASARETITAVPHPPAPPAPAAGHARRAALLPLGTALVDAAEAEHVRRESRRHGKARVDHRPELTGQLYPTRVPPDLEAQRVLHFDEPRARE